MSQNSTNQPRRPSRSDVTTYVYRFFRADGALLYIGVTSDLNHRFQAHQKKPWWGQVDYSTVAAHGNRALALAAEAMAILEEKPLHNIQRPNRARVDELQDRAFGTPVKETSPYDPVSVLARAHDRIEALKSDLSAVRAALGFVTADRDRLEAEAAAAARIALSTRNPERIIAALREQLAQCRSDLKEALRRAERAESRLKSAVLQRLVAASRPSRDR